MKRQTKRILSKAALIAAYLAIFIAFLITSVAIEHNAMGEFYKDIGAPDLEYDLGHLFLIWLSWFLPAFLIGFVVFSLVGMGGNKSNKPKKFKGSLPAITAALFSLGFPSFLLWTALDPGHSEGEFCIDRRAAVCEFEIFEMATFWGFWFLIPLGILTGLIALNFLLNKKEEI